MAANSKKRHFDNQSGFPSGMMFWCLSFFYAVCIALMFQKLILPMLPGLHAGNGLLTNDAVVFHERARHIAELINGRGWSQWSPFPGGFANVGLLSAVYAVFGPEPAFFIPINAAAHATGALMIYLIGERLWPGKVGRLGGLIGGILFLTFPSALQWYGQNHKDAFAIAAILTMMYAWISVFDREFTGRMLALVTLMFCGATLLAIMRPHYSVLVLTGFTASWFLLLVVSFIDRSRRRNVRIFSIAFCMLMVILIVSTVSIRSKSISENYLMSFSDAGTGDLEMHGQTWAWKHSEILPAQIDRTFERVSRIRAYFISYNKSIGAGSMIDVDRSPNDTVSLFTYLPRALVVGLFSPFPNTWTDKVSPPRLVGAVETLIWYIIASGIVVLIKHRPSRSLFAGLIFAIFFIAMLSYVHPNIGTLYRQRFSVWLFILLCGAIGWANIILTKVLTHAESDPVTRKTDMFSSQYLHGTSRMERLAASGTVVLIITFCCYLGFMARDLMLIRIYGMNAELDAYFAAAMIPMFLVTFLAMPMSDALTAPFLRWVAERDVNQTYQLVRKVMFISTLILGVATVLVVTLADELLPIIIGATTVSVLREGSSILRLYAPLILLSAWTIVGNSILNAMHHSRQAALTQLLVPVVAIGAILVVPVDKVLYGAALGMLAGTLLNAVVVMWLVKRLGYTLLPANYTATTALRDVSLQYRWLAAAALFTVAATPLNYFFAGTIEHGAISAWALASKMVTLFNGLASVGIAAVILPHLARLMTRRAIKEVKNDVFFLLLTGTWIGFGLALVVFVFSEPLIFTLFHGSQISDAKVKELADVVKIGCLQLPMVVTYAVLVKIAAVTGRSSKAVVAALSSIVISVGCNIVLVPQFGVLGLALGSVVATGVSSAFLLTATRSVSLLSVTEVLILIFNWTILAFISVSCHFGYWGAITSSALGLLILAWATWWVWHSHRGSAYRETIS